MKKTLFVLMLLVAICFGVFAGWTMNDPGPPPPPVIEEKIVEVMVPVEVVKEIAGEPTIIERVKWRTKTVDVPSGTLEELARGLCPQTTSELPIGAELVVDPDDPPLTGSFEAFPPSAPQLEAVITIDADRFEGTEEGSDKLVSGWVGRAVCSARFTGGEWFVIHQEPFDLLTSTAVTVRPLGDEESRLKRWRTELRLGVVSSPGLDFGASFYRHRRWGVYFSGQYDLNPTNQVIFDPSQERILSDYEADRWRLSAGLALSIGRK